MSESPGRSKKGGWGSLLSGAVAGLESRLDTILGDDDQASAKQRAALEASKQTKVSQPAALRADTATSSRASSKTRTNDRLQERLAKAMAKNTENSPRVSSDIPQRTSSPALTDTEPPVNADSQSFGPQTEGGADKGLEAGKESMEYKPVQPTINGNVVPIHTEPMDSHPENLPSVRPSTPRPATPEAGLTRSSQDSLRRSATSTPAPSTPPTSFPAALAPSAFLQGDSAVSSVGEAPSDYQATLNGYLERIDALHAKITYLATSSSAAAREAAASSDSGSVKQKLAEKDEKIAELVKEGTQLSAKEIKALNAARTLQTRVKDGERLRTDLKASLEKAEREAADAKDRAERAEGRERGATEQLKVVPKLQKDIEGLKVEKTSNATTITELRRQIADSEKKLADAEKRSQKSKLEEQTKAVAELNDELSNARIEKKLVEDRGKTELKEVREEAARQQEKARIMEMELRVEIQNFESKLEVLRAQTESMSTDAPSAAQSTLLRQVDTLQTQYDLANQNWQGIETGLNARISALEKDRDELAAREANARKKTREVGSKTRRLEEELESLREASEASERQKTELTLSATSLKEQLSAAEKTQREAQLEFERERKAFEETLQTRLEEERTKIKLEYASSNKPSSVPPSESASNLFLRTASPPTFFTQRKTSNSDLRTLHSRRNPSFSASRTFSPVDLPSLSTEPFARSPTTSRRPSTQPPPSFQQLRSPSESIAASRQDPLVSVPYTNGSPSTTTPTIEIEDNPVDLAESASSPHHTVNDLVSVSTVGAGPSVQLVERMSAAVRRLESEKAAWREEMTRLTAQRDEAREEVVKMMREAEVAKMDRERLDGLETEMGSLKTRYETALEMVGEKSEECEELRGDVAELKRIYRELVERTVK